MEQKTNTGWVVATALAIAVIVLAGMLWWGWGEKKDIDSVLSDGYADLAMIRAEIAIKCEGPEADKEACDEALQELSEILEEFSHDIDIASTSMQATTTP